ncbi:hypothetical protein RDABS01_024514 [Bienertia sinuspersici]
MSAGSAMYSCTSKIKKVRYDLFRWCQQYKKQHHTMWEDLNESCTKAQLTIGRTSTITDEHQIHQQSMEEATIKLKFWRQRAKGKWLELADSNTKFFFRRAKGRKKRNEILLLQTSDGNWVHGKSEVKGLLTQHFQHIYQSGPLNGSLPPWEPPPPNFAIFSTLDKAQADCLIAEVTDAEYTGEIINFDKSLVMFSPNTPSTVRDQCKAHLGTQVGDAVGKYLGNFIEVNGRNLKVYQELVTKMQQKLLSWEHLCLSPAGRLLFANSILASLTLGNMTDLTIGSPGWASGHSPRLRQGATLTQATMVADLLDQGGGHWKPSIIWSQFTHQSARQILSTHIPNQSATEGFSWKLTGTGTLSSKSAYHLLTTSHPDQDDSRTSFSVWKFLWSSPIPPKWKVFMWRVLWNALPLKSNLNKRGIGVNNMCLLCGDSVETNEHLFRDCSFVDRLWACGNLGIRCQNATPLPLWRWIMDYLFLFKQQADSTSSRTNTFITALWSIWNFRNKILFAGLQPTPMNFLQLMVHYDWELKMFIHHKAKTAIPFPSPPHSIRATRGGCPTSSSPHLIVDGAWKLQQNGTQIAGIGWVQVNSDNQITMGSEPIISISPLQAETKALLSGIQASKMEGITDLRVFTDCSTIGNLILKRQPGPPEIQTLLQSLEEAMPFFIAFN